MSETTRWTGPAPPQRSRSAPQQNGGRDGANLADILERVLDKGIVIAGDIQVNLLDIELLTIKIRLVVASVDRAKEMGIDWWERDPTLSAGRRELEDENRELRARIEALEQGRGIPAGGPDRDGAGEDLVADGGEEPTDGDPDGHDVAGEDPADEVPVGDDPAGDGAAGAEITEADRADRDVIDGELLDEEMDGRDAGGRDADGRDADDRNADDREPDGGEAPGAGRRRRSPSARSVRADDPDARREAPTRRRAGTRRSPGSRGR